MNTAAVESGRANWCTPSWHPETCHTPEKQITILGVPAESNRPYFRSIGYNIALPWQRKDDSTVCEILFRERNRRTGVAYLVHELAVGLHVCNHLLTLLDGVWELEQCAQMSSRIQLLSLLAQRLLSLAQSLPTCVSPTLEVPERAHLELFQLSQTHATSWR